MFECIYGQNVHSHRYQFEIGHSSAPIQEYYNIEIMPSSVPIPVDRVEQEEEDDDDPDEGVVKVGHEDLESDVIVSELKAPGELRTWIQKHWYYAFKKALQTLFFVNLSDFSINEDKLALKLHALRYM